MTPWRPRQAGAGRPVWRTVKDKPVRLLLRVFGRDRMSVLFKQKWLRWFMVIIFCSLIYLATASTHYTADSTGQLFGPLNIIIRKATHVTVFGLLAGLVRWALDGRRWAWFWAWSFATLGGASDEWHQYYVPDRGASMADVLLNSVGAFVALLLLHLWIRRKTF